MAMMRKLSDPLYDNEEGLVKSRVRKYYQPFGQPFPPRQPRAKFVATVEVDVGNEFEVDFIRFGKRLSRDRGGTMIPVPKADLRLHFNKGQLVEIEFMEKGMIPARTIRQKKA